MIASIKARTSPIATARAPSKSEPQSLAPDEGNRMHGDALPTGTHVTPLVPPDAKPRLAGLITLLG